jgi:Protein of unknown function (DUF1488)
MASPPATRNTCQRALAEFNFSIMAFSFAAKLRPEVFVHARRHVFVVLIRDVFAYHLRVQEAVTANAAMRRNSRARGHLTDVCSSELTDIDLSTWHNEIPPGWSVAMPLQRGEVQGYDFDRMTVEFTMLNQGKIIMCAISTAAMDNIEGTRDVRPDQRVDQFMRLRDVIEERASRKFFEEQVQVDRPVVLRSNDFAL